MKKVMMFAALAAVVGMVAGCVTSATAYTNRTDKAIRLGMLDWE